MATQKRRPPDVLTPTDQLTREEWLAFRRRGIGGSDAAAVLGISPFRTGVDLYYDKLGLPVAESEENWVAMEMGNLLEDLVARIFAKKTGLKVTPMKMMFQHPDYPWMLADLDRLVILPNGSTAILEIKTTNYNARDKWEYDGRPIVPPYDLKNEFVLFPKHLQQAHDQAQSRVKQRQVEKFDTQIASQRKRLKRQYQFKSSGLVVLPPHSAQEIVVEGQKLHHCVGRYAEQMAEGDCAILFLRQEREVETPYYTVEVQGDNIIQVRGAHNCAPTPEVKEFLNAWEEKKHLKGVA